MATDILADLGHLFLGSRLKRLAERLQADAIKVIRAAGLPIQPAQFPLLAALDRFGPCTITELVEALGASQPVVTRNAGGLIELGLVTPGKPGADLRHKPLMLTDAGVALMKRAKERVWPRIDRAVAEMCEPLAGPLLDQLGQLERQLDQASLEQRVRALAPAPDDLHAGLSIREYTDDLAEDFYRINAEWIEQMFTMEPNDREILSRPRELIIDRGGVILFVEAPDLGVIGACALIKIDEGQFELTKMGVSASARGRKAGEFLLAAILDRAATMDIQTLYLLTNTQCASAIHLYEKLGFVHDAEIMRTYGARYERCNVAMALPSPARPVT